MSSELERMRRLREFSVSKESSVLGAAAKVLNPVASLVGKGAKSLGSAGLRAAGIVAGAAVKRPKTTAAIGAAGGVGAYGTVKSLQGANQGWNKHKYLNLSPPKQIGV